MILTLSLKVTFCYHVILGYYSRQAPPIDFDMKNPLCRFKAISYSLRPRTENKDGFVSLIINKKDSQIRFVIFKLFFEQTVLRLPTNC